ncbi:phage tail protein, partial [Aggregatibacter actinomycetemcomitans]|uniref:phage tail protein n=1 Tax=Aggregatibacter actinomycetemcomitans TaxID=714 RepID=UPI001F1B4E7D
AGRGRKRLKKDGQRNKFFQHGNVTPGNVATDETIPGFRGIVTTVFSGLISCYNAYPKKHSYRLRRALKGWHNGVWYPEKCKIVLRNDNLKIKGVTAEQEENLREIHAMNPAHILVECATNKSWGGRKELSELDLDSYKKAADTLYDEGFGLCIRYNRQTSIKEFIKQIVDHIGAAQYDNVETGKQAIKLIRQDYNVADLPLFSYDNGIVAVLDDDSAATDKQANQIIVKYREPVTNREDQAIANNIAAVQMHGVISKTVEYKGVPTFDLAARLAQRDLEMIASGLTRLKITFDMRGSELRPGDVIRLNLPERDIVDVVFRIGELKNGGNEGEIVATCLQDVFGLPAANYSTQKGESLYIPPDYTAKPIEQARLFEVPYHVLPLVLSDAERAFIKPTDCFVWSLGAQPSALSVGYDMLVNVGAGYTQTATGSFTPFIRLADAAGAYQTTLKFKLEGDYAALDNAEAIMIDDEIIKIDSVDFNAGTMTVGRGCADTIPQPHKADAMAWCYLLAAGTDETKYTVGENIKAKLLTRTAQQTLDEEKAAELTLTTRQRQARPYPPGNVRIDGSYTNAIRDGSSFKLTWAHRDRDVQAEKLIAHTEDSTVRGEGVSYKLELLDGDTVVRSIDTTDTQFDYPDAKKAEGEQFSQIALYSVKNGLHSLHKYLFNVQGALLLLHKFDYQATWSAGDNYLNRYNDGYFGGLGYIMLSDGASPTTDIYNDYAIAAGQYARFVLDYKILSYAQRKGKCRVIVQLLSGADVVQSYQSELLGDWTTDDWHRQQVADSLAQNVDKIRVRIEAQPGVSRNALAFRDITIRVGHN